ncbi:hypothetical protein [Arthrobacter sp. H35-D1]|uniref:hypothetical protein n=1 Tax=Arthrobacter sp. H35-D1 TaxID=3046202 RepID=UPI0024BA719F|nr:hypothetical protein [Arthrobacter sp. H35-D1]MDJ0313041.1 hypothetical protein [Arthrobacter sp. H35-D1]
MTRMIALALVLLAAAMAVSAVASWISRRKPRRALGTGTASAVASRQAEDRAMLAAQVRAVGSLVFAVVMFLALFRASIGLTGQVGLPLALTAGLSASGGLLLYSTLPVAKQQVAKQPFGTGGSGAGLPRNPWAFASRWALALPAVVLLVYIAFIVAAGLTSSPDELGRYRMLRLENADVSAAASPYPGWFYGLPLLVVAVLMAGSALLALVRVSRSPSLPDPRMAALDRRWREISIRALLRITTGALLGYLGGIALVAGQAMANAGKSFESVQGWGVAIAAVGAALALAGVVLLVMAARDALTIRTTARQSKPEPAAAP